MQTLTEKLLADAKPDLKKEFGYKNDMEIPKIKMVSVNSGINASENDNNTLLYILAQISNFSGQKSVITKSKKSISSFKLREGVPVGCMVTLRGKKMYSFLDKVINIALPRIKDFRGLPRGSFNQSGHYTFGIKDHSVFLEVPSDDIGKSFGLNITIVTTSKTAVESLYLLKKLNFPIR